MIEIIKEILRGMKVRMRWSNICSTGGLKGVDRENGVHNRGRMATGFLELKKNHDFTDSGSTP